MTSASPIREQLMLLMELQELDNEIIEFELGREEIPDKMGDLEGGLLEKRKSLDEIETQIHGIEDELVERQKKMDLEKLKLKNTRNKEAAIQNIKEYEAFIKEIETQEKTSGDYDREITALNERLEILKEDYAKIEKEIEALTATQLEQKRELKETLAKLDETLEELYDRRDELADKLEEDIYLKYEYIAERKDGIAVAPVEHGHCSVCNMAISPQMYNELIRGDWLMACPACNRILVYKEETDEAE